MFFHHQGKTEILGLFFGDQLALRSTGNRLPVMGAQREVRNSARRGHVKSVNKITPAEVTLATQDISN